MKETQETSTYTESALTEGEIVKGDFEYVKRMGLVSVTVKEAQQICAQDPGRPPNHTWFHERIPTFGVSLKMHKANTLRFMAKSHNTSLTQLSTWMSKAFSSMMPVSEEIWKRLFLKIGIVTHGSWVITNSKQVRSRMERMQNAGLAPHSDGQQTYDFSTMYTSMHLKAIKKKMSEYVDLVFEYKRQSAKGNQQVLVVKRKGKSYWTNRIKDQHNTDNTKYITARRLKQWIRYLLKRLFVKVGDKIMLQTVGLPMGTSCSPFIANLVLFMYEFEYFTNQVAKIKPWHVEGTPRHSTLRKLSFCSRYIDDLWNPLVGREEFGSIVQKIYPSWLQLGMECCGTSVNYLDMTIWCNNKTEWNSKLYDKKIGMIAKGLKLNKFPHPESKLSSRCKYGVITSQLHRYNVACTTIKHFLEPAVELYRAYVNKGYVVGKIDRYFECFIRNKMNGMRPDTVKRIYNNVRRQ